MNRSNSTCTEMESTSLRASEEPLPVSKAGQAVGGMTTGVLADKYNQRWTLPLVTILTIVGAVMQCAAMHVGIMIAGRLLAGTGCGQLISVVDIYIAEVAPPKRRGFLVGLQGLTIAIDFRLADWVGYAGPFASENAQRRIHVAMQLPVPIGMTVMPLLRFLHSAMARYQRLDEDFADRELFQIRAQIIMEKEHGDHRWLQAIKQMLSKQHGRRTLLAAFIVTMGQLSGSSVIQNFQGIFYETVGFVGNEGVLISGVYGMRGLIGQIIYLPVVANEWPGKVTLWSGSPVLAIALVVWTALSAEFGSGSNANQADARAAIGFIFINYICYAINFNAMIWVVRSDLFPFFLRTWNSETPILAPPLPRHLVTLLTIAVGTKGLALAVASKSTAAITLSQITTLALDNVSWRYYFLFVVMNLAAACIYFFLLLETSGKSLEDVATLFGDELASKPVDQIHVEEKSVEIEHDKQRQRVLAQQSHRNTALSICPRST